MHADPTVSETAVAQIASVVGTVAAATVVARRPFVTQSELIHRAKALTRGVPGIDRGVSDVWTPAELRAFWQSALVACLAHLDAPEEAANG